MDDDDEVLTVAEAAVLLRVGRNQVYALAGRNEIPHRRLGKHLRFTRRALMAWLASWSSQGAVTASVAQAESVRAAASRRRFICRPGLQPARQQVRRLAHQSCVRAPRFRGP